jgi:uncharacterized protein involved in copper resistance
VGNALPLTAPHAVRLWTTGSCVRPVRYRPTFSVSNKGKVRFKGTYGTLLTGRLILQPRFVTEIEFQRDSEFGVVQGINNVETVLRLVYKVRRELVPYFAVTFRQSSMPRLNASNAKVCVPSALEFVIGLRAWH